MITIVYASRATAPMTDRALEALLATARERNERAGVTGMLLYAYQSFLQQLEGDEQEVDAIFDSITRDPRHTDLRLLSRRPVEHRTYAGWWMGFEHPDADTLTRRLTGYRCEIKHPLVTAELIHTTEIAETLLQLAAGSPHTTTH